MTDMDGMFSGCPSLLEISLAGFDTSHVTNMCYLFNGCSSLSTLDLASFQLVGDCVDQRKAMFGGADRLSRLTLLTGFNVEQSMQLINGEGSEVDRLGWVVEMGDKSIDSSKGIVATIKAPVETTTLVWRTRENGHAYDAPVWDWKIDRIGRGSSMTVDAVVSVSFRCMYCEDVQVPPVKLSRSVESHYMALTASTEFNERTYHRLRKY